MAAFAVKITLAVLKDHDGRGLCRVVLRRSVDRVVAYRAVVDSAVQGQPGGEMTRGYPSLQLGNGRWGRWGR